MILKGTLEDCKRVYEMLGDQESRDIYLNRLNWLISGNPKYLRNIIPEYLPKLLLPADRPKLIAEAIQDLKDTLPADRNIIFYGAGQYAPFVLDSWGEDERLIGFCSRTKSKQKSGYYGYPVMSPEELLARKDLSVVLSVDDAVPKNEIKQVLREGNYPANQIYEIPGVSIVADKDQYFGPDFIKLGENEVFVDAGCFDLGTSLEFKRRSRHVKKIYAFEPDPSSYQICSARKNEESFSEVELFPYGVWSERTTLCFNATHGGDARVDKNGETKVSVVSIDEMIDPADQVTMIKMDIEGAELEALKGTRATIQRDKPKLAICIYHKPEDMIEIPLYIKEMVPEYKLYVRHHSNTEHDTVLYAVVPE